MAKTINIQSKTNAGGGSFITNKYFIAGALLVAAVLGYAVYKKREKLKDMYGKLMDELDRGTSESGTVDDLNKTVFSPNYRKGKGTITLWDSKTVAWKIEKIHGLLDGLMSFINIDEDEVEAFFNAMPSKLHANQIAVAYRNKYGVDLSSDLKNMGEEDAQRIMDIINAKPEKA